MFDFEKRLTEIGRQTILCIGDLMLDDFVYGDVSRISPEAPAPVIRVSREDVIVGGAGNVARNIASLGAKCLFVGVIGDDVAGTILREELSREQARDQVASRGRSLAPDDAEAPLRLRASFDASAARRLGAGAAGRCQDRSGADQAGAGAAAEGRRGGAVRLRQGRADAESHSRRDRAREEARQAGHRRSQGQRFLDLSRRDRHHAEPQGTGRGDAPAGRTPATRSRRRRRRWPARSAARRCW